MEKDKLKIYLEHAKNAALEAGKLIEAKERTGYKIIRKHIKELVTEIDMVVQSQLVNYLQANTNCYTVFSEEVRISEIENKDCWVIDPLDGTHNFVAGLPFYGVSIAYVEQGEIVLGVIYFPKSKDLYYARKGGGVFRNNKRIRVSSNNDIEKSIVAYDNQFYLTKDVLSNFQKIQEKVFTIRILGVASRDACFVAEGTLDARVWNSTKLYDIAAGALIVKEAGGQATDFSGSELRLQAIKDVIISSGGIHAELVNILRKDKK